MGFSQCIDTILNRTELYTRSNEHVHLTSEISTSRKLLTDGVEHIWAFLSTQIPSWTELYTRSNDHVHLTSECLTWPLPAGNFWQMGWSAYGLFEHIDTILNWTELYTRSNEHVHLTSECPTRSPPAGQRRSGRHSCAQPRQRQGSSDPARSCCPTQSSPACPCKEICQYFSFLLLRWISLSTLTV